MHFYYRSGSDFPYHQFQLILEKGKFPNIIDHLFVSVTFSNQKPFSIAVTTSNFLVLKHTFT